MSTERGKSRRDGETNPSAYRKLLSCSHCPPHRHENEGRKAKHGAQKPKSKKGKRS